MSRAAILGGVRVAICGIALLSMASCSWLGRRHRAGCDNPQIGNTQNLPALQVPSGLDAPDTRNAIKVPPLNEPERPRTSADSCLALPPGFQS